MSNAATESSAARSTTHRTPDPRSRVSAVMLTCGQWDYTRRCIESLRDDLQAGMELVVVDNASTDGTPDALRRLLEPYPRVRVVDSPVNLGFAAGSNLGTESSTGPYVLFINNDVVVPRGWLERMLAHFEASASVGMVGPRSNRVAGQQVLSTVPYDEDTLEGFEAFAARLAREQAGVAERVGRIIGFCLMARRAVIDRIGGFDPRFGIGNFEDDDFCLRAHLAGFETVQAEDVVVHHFGGRTFAGQGIDRNASIEANWSIFKRKWGLPASRSLAEFYGDADVARMSFDAASHHVPLDSYRREARRRLCGEAEEYLARNDRPGAAARLEQAIPFEPNDEELPLMAAALHFREDRPGRAAGLALEAIRIRPFHPSAMNLLGVACVDCDRPDLGKKILARTVRLAPRFAQAKENLSSARRAFRRSKKAAAKGRKPGQTLPLDDVKKVLNPGAPVLTACVVVRRDPEYLDDCLDSLGGMADEILILDATDRRDVDRFVTDRQVTVRERAWRGDESAVWNELLAHARGDWILCLEAVERLHPESLRELRDSLRSSRSLGYAVEVRRPSGGGGRMESRLFRNAPGIRFTGSVDSRADRSLREAASRWGLEINRASVVLDRVGPFGAGCREEMARQREAVGRELDENPNSTHVRTQRARLDLERGDATHALTALREVIRDLATDPLGPGEIEEEEIATLEGRCLLRLQRFPELLERMREYHAKRSPTHNTLFLEGVARRASGDPHGAVKILESSVESSGKASFQPPMDEVRGAGACNMLGAAWLDLGDVEAAREAFKEALRRDEDNLEARLGLMSLRLVAGQLDEVLQELDDLANERGDNVGVWTVGAAVLGRVPQLATQAEAWMEEACRRFPDHSELGWHLGEASSRRGNLSRALEVWDRSEPGDPAKLAGLFAARLASGRELPAIPSERHEAVAEGVLAWFERWMAYSSYEALDRALLGIGQADDRLPGLASRTAGWLDRIGQAEAAARIRQRVPRE